MTAIVLMAAGLLPVGTVAARWLASMTFWPVATQIDGSYWSLGIEVAFYLLIATQLVPLYRSTREPIAQTLLVLVASTRLSWL